MASHLSRDSGRVKADRQHCPGMRKQKMEMPHKTPRITEEIPQRKLLDGAHTTEGECGLSCTLPPPPKHVQTALLKAVKTICSALCMILFSQYTEAWSEWERDHNYSSLKCLEDLTHLHSKELPVER